MSDEWTIGRLLTWTTDYLREQGSESPRLDAEVLLAHARDCQRIELYTSFEEVAGDDLRSSFRSLVKRRAAGEPVAYLVGQREFYSLPFTVSRDVLIPRPETEYIVTTLLDKAKATRGVDHAWRIADVGTGSGILAVCAATHLPQSQVTAIDISTAALAVARQNMQQHQVAGRVELLEGDLLTGLPAEPTFDFILSNPPYIGEGELPGLAADVREHEPHQALIAGPTGLETIEQLIPQAAQRLAATGWLIMEISPPQAGEVSSLLNAENRWSTVEVFKDLDKQDRVIAAQLA